MAVQKFLTSVDLNGQELLNASLEKRAAAPSFAQGIVYEDTTTAVDNGFGSFFRIFYGEDTAYKSVALSDEIVAIKTYIDNLALKGIRLQGTGDYSQMTTYPTNPAATGQTGVGSGTAGAIKQGDAWMATVGGLIGTLRIDQGDVLVAATDTPGQTASKWIVMQYAVPDATTAIKGITRIATTLEATTGTEAFAYITPATLQAVLANSVKTRSEKFLAQSLVANTAKTITLVGTMADASDYHVTLKQGGTVVFAQIDNVGTGSFTITSAVAATVDVFVTYLAA